MAKIKIELTEDHLALISNFHFQEVPDTNSENDQKMTWGLDLFNLYGGTSFEDISYIIGCYDKHIEGTEEEPLGAKFPKEIEDHIFALHSYIIDNIRYIEDLVHFYCNKGGLKPGTYTCLDYQLVWNYQPFNE